MNIGTPHINRTILTIALLFFGVKLILLPFAQTVDADAVSRIFLSHDWKNNPHWIATSVWAPFHFYLNGAALMIWDNVIYTPKLVNIIFSVGTLFPFYFFTKREFNAQGAIIATIFFGLCPILFRNSFMGLSETPYLFFLVVSLNLISKAIHENSTKTIILAGLALTVSAGFRYEAWFLLLLLSFLLLFIDWKKAFIFGAVAMIFPVIWMYSEWHATGLFPFSLEGSTGIKMSKGMNVAANNVHLDLESILRRIWFFPFSWLIAVGIPVVYLLIKPLFVDIFKKSTVSLHRLWALLFVITLLFFIYNALQGALLIQHRFIGTLVVFSLPFIAVYFEINRKRRIRKALIFGAVTVGMSLIYNTSGIAPIPRLKDQHKATFIRELNLKLQPNDKLVIDFIGWDYSYYYLLKANLNRSNILIVEDPNVAALPTDRIEKILSENGNVYILENKTSDFKQYLKTKNNLQIVTLKGQPEEYNIYKSTQQ